jgi:outer membrane protein TolC
MRSLLRNFRRSRAWLAATALAAGCAGSNPAIRYLGDGDMRYYRGAATEIDYPDVVSETPPELSASLAPHTIREVERPTVRDITLAEAMHTAFMNSEVIRSDGEFLSPGNSLLASPDRVPSVYDAAIQETGVLFGGRGVEAALAAFDAQLTTSMIWGRDEQIQNNLFFGGGLGAGGTLTRETAQFQSSLEKIFAHGGVVSVNHNIDYLWSNVPGVLFNSAYTGNVQVQYAQPLLAGAGTEYTRIAGPIVQGFGGITGVSQGVLVARINNDITIAQFDANVQNLALDVESAYWNLYLAYRRFDTATVARNSALDTWRLTKKQAGEVLIPADEAQARSTLYAAESATQTSQTDIYHAETRLRRLMGLAVNDGTVLRPIDEPVTTELAPDWFASLTEALSQRVELRAQKWNIKSLELQLTAARSLTRPRLDFLSSYQVNGFGDDLLDYQGNAFNSYYQSLTANNQTGWNLGLQMNWPIGLRSAHAQVRNYELRLTKARKVLSQQELEIGHELAAAFQELTRSYATMRSNYLRYVATEENVRGLEPRVLTEDNVDVILRAYERRAAAEADYYQSLVEYNLSLATLQYRKGAILAYNNIALMEGGWVPEAYNEANRHAQARGYARDAKHLHSYPHDFAVDAPVGRAVFTSEQAAGQPPEAMQPVPDVPPAPEPAPPADEAPPPGEVPSAGPFPPGADVSQAQWQVESAYPLPAAASPPVGKMKRDARPASAEADEAEVFRHRERIPPSSGLYDF